MHPAHSSDRSAARPVVALATCAELPGHEVDDQALVAALEALDAEVRRPAWDDPEADWAGCDACLIRSTWDYESRRGEYVAWAWSVAAATRLWNPPEIVSWNTHKSYLQDLEERGVPIVPTIWLADAENADLGEALDLRGWRRAFLKPLVGHTAQSTLRFDATPEGLAAASSHLREVRQPMLLQPYLTSVETEGELSVIFIDGEPSHAVRKIPVAGDYRVQDDFGASDHPVELSSDEAELARSIVAVVDADLLYARVDLLRDDRGELRLSELELVEPSLFFRHAPEAAERLAAALLDRISSSRPAR